jgi:hypothetical protein
MSRLITRPIASACIHYITVYILPRFIFRPITSCLDPLHALLHWHVPLHASESITCSRIHYIHCMLPNPLHAGRMMWPVFTVINLLVFTAAAAQRSLRRPAGATSAVYRAVNRPSSDGFHLPDNIPARDDQCSIQMRWRSARGHSTAEVEQCRWWLGRAVLGISRMSILNIQYSKNIHERISNALATMSFRLRMRTKSQNYMNYTNITWILHVCP